MYEERAMASMESRFTARELQFIDLPFFDTSTD